MQETNLTDGQAAVELFELWMELFGSGELPDSKRYRNEFFTAFGGRVTEHAPIYLMFCAFVGALDMDDMIKHISVS